MALNLTRKGASLTVYGQNAEACNGSKELGTTVAESVAGFAAHCDFGLHHATRAATSQVGDTRRPLAASSVILAPHGYGAKDFTALLDDLVDRAGLEKGLMKKAVGANGF